MIRKYGVNIAEFKSRPNDVEVRVQNNPGEEWYTICICGTVKSAMEIALALSPAKIECTIQSNDWKLSNKDK